MGKLKTLVAGRVKKLVTGPVFLVWMRITEGMITAGLLSLWAGLLHYHVVNKEIEVPEYLPDNRASRAILRMLPELDNLSFFLAVIGASVAGFFGLIGLFALRSRQKSKYIGMFASFALTVSSWHIFRKEGRETVNEFISTHVDLWGPITSNLVMLFMSMLLMHHNLLQITFFPNLPDPARTVCDICIVVGVVCAQVYFSVMVLLSFTGGIVLLACSPFLILLGYVGGQVWEHIHMRTHAAEDIDEKESLVVTEA